VDGLKKMKIKIAGIVACILLILNSTTLAFTISSHDEQQMKQQFADMQSTDRESPTVFEYNGGWDSGSFSGSDLWHQTSVDSWSGDFAMGCFNEDTHHYEDNMNFNYLITNDTFSMDGAIEMKVTYYCKYITEGSEDYWGIVLYDPIANDFHSFESFYGYHPTWTTDIFDIKSAYEQCYQLGFFRNLDGSRSYDFRIGFAFIKTNGSGVTNPQAEALGQYWTGIFIDDVTISRLDTNNPPNTPAVPSGPDVGTPGTSYVFSTVTTDPESDKILYGWDWDEDGTVDQWTGLSASNSPVSTMHSFVTTGMYYIKVIALDEKGESSDFSLYKMVIITNRPNKPVTPVGETKGKFNNSYWYSTSTTDPDGDQLEYFWDWGDGTDSGWLGQYHSGDNCAITHKWAAQGNYNIKVKAKDIHGVESDWSDPLPIAMPYSYYKSFLPFLEWLWQRFPHTFPMLQQ
jgi:hypothetical protein